MYVADAGCYPTVIVSFFPVNRTSSRLRYDTGHNRPRSAGLCSGSREGAEWSNLITGIPFLVTNDWSRVKHVSLLSTVTQSTVSWSIGPFFSTPFLLCSVLLCVPFATISLRTQSQPTEDGREESESGILLTCWSSHRNLVLSISTILGCENSISSLSKPLLMSILLLESHMS